jgi:hypothetical protein
MRSAAVVLVVGFFLGIIVTVAGASPGARLEFAAGGVETPATRAYQRVVIDGCRASRSYRSACFVS